MAGCDKAQPAAGPFTPPHPVDGRAECAGRPTPGDWAEVRLEPGLLAFLMAPPAGCDVPLARGTHPMSGLPLGLAVEAAIAASSGRATGATVLRACQCTYESPASAFEALAARATVTETGPRHVGATAEVRSAADRRLVMRATLTLVRVGGDGRAAPILGDTAAGDEQAGDK